MAKGCLTLMLNLCSMTLVTSVQEAALHGERLFPCLAREDSSGRRASALFVSNVISLVFFVFFLLRCLRWRRFPFLAVQRFF